MHSRGCHCANYSRNASSFYQRLPAAVDLFFERLYPLPSYAFLHPATTKTRCAERKLELPLAYAICGLVSFKCDFDAQDSGFACIQMAEQIIWQQLERLTILSRLEALLLIIHYRKETGRFQRAFMLIAMAARAAAAMRLNHEHPELNPVAQEKRRRLVWSLKLVERYFSIGLQEFEVCPYETLYIQLPSREDEFNLRNHPRGFASEDRDEVGAYRLCIKLEAVRRDVMKLSRYIDMCDESFPQLPKLIQGLERELANVELKLPHGADLTPAALITLLSNRWLPRHVFLYLSWHQCHCDLYRLMLSGYQEAAPSAGLRSLDPTYSAKAEYQCLQHASSIVRIVTSLNEQSTLPHSLDFDTAICVYQSVRLIFFISRFGKGINLPSSEFATSRAALCIAALKRFFPSSVLVRPIVNELERVMKEFTSRGIVPQRWSSAPEQPEYPNDPSRKLSSVAKARQKFAIHSLLLQAEFADDEDDDMPPWTNASSPSIGSLLTVQRGHTLPSPVDSSLLHPPAASDSAESQWSPMGAASLASPGQYSDYPMPLDSWDMDTSAPEQPQDLQFPLFPWFGLQSSHWPLTSDAQ